MTRKAAGMKQRTNQEKYCESKFAGFRRFEVAENYA